MRESNLNSSMKGDVSGLPSCPECDSPALENRCDEETFEYGGREKPFTVTARIPSQRCKACGFTFYDDAAQAARHEAACRHLGVMTPSEIRKLRGKKCGLTQEKFAELTCLGVATIGRWERGVGIQNEAYDAFLYLLTFSENVGRLRGRRQRQDPKETVSQGSRHGPKGTFSLYPDIEAA